ncbi:MAG: RagB/SusD family nutrient uptake outer membrane protein [Bacteroidales bacterium]|nr:RagB/SusD family nutrient uptake outer membrane protein [Bacteroidales bacterium]
MKRIIILLAFCLAALTSCNKYLKETNLTKYSIDYIYSTPEGLKLAVTALYDKDRSILSESTENATWAALIRGTDLVTTNGGTGNFYGIYDPNYLKPSATQVSFLWKTMYSIIGSCNEIIAAGEKMEQTEDVRVSVAEAKCFRAQSYFHLFRVYDRIWLNKVPTTPENLNQEREFYPAAQSDVFDLIYNDLKYAIDALEWTSYQPGRFNQAAARHLLAKAALWIKDWKTALEQVDAIDACGEYSLMDVDKVFYGASLNHSEALFVQEWSTEMGGSLSTTTPKGHYLATLFIGLYRQEIGGTNEEACSYDNYGFTYGRCLVSPYLLSLYDQKNDKRYSEWYVLKYKNTKKDAISVGGISVKPGEYLPSRNSKGELIRNLMPGCIKYADIWTREPFEARSCKDVIIYRLGETYIMGAEAALMLGDQSKARYYYNKTWRRAGNPEFTGALTIKNIIDEQARELAFEGDRWFFLKRKGILIDQVKNYAGNPEYAPSILGRTNLPANPHMVRWPIPESEIINMGAETFPQNPGY